MPKIKHGRAHGGKKVTHSQRWMRRIRIGHIGH